MAVFLTEEKISLCNLILDNNRNWRDAKDNQAHESLTRTKSWSRMQNNGESDLPEWCMDDSVDGSMPGSFDASGQFRAFKVSLFT